ncbi:EAL domain-containing protein [Peptostreptococcaceae bacterium AGR-M142]
MKFNNMNTDILKSYSIVIKRLFLFIIPILIILNLGYSKIYNTQIKLIKSKITSNQVQLLSAKSFILKSKIKNVYEVLNLIKNSNELVDYLNDSNQTKENEVYQMFSRVLNSKKNFIEMIYIDNNEDNIIKVLKESGNIKFFKDIKSDITKYNLDIESIKNLKEDELFISEIKRNEREQYKIMDIYVYFSIPIYKDNLKLGNLIIKNNAQEFIEIIESGEIIDLYGSTQGIYSLKNFYSFKEESEKIKENIINIDIKKYIDDFDFSNLKSKTISKNNDFLYLLKLNNFEHIKLIFENKKNWVLASFLKVDDLKIYSQDFIVKYPFIRYIILIFVFIVLMAINILEYIKEKNNLMLVASGYISEYTNDAILISDRNKKIIYCNKMFENIYGYKFKEIKGLKPSEFLNGDTSINFSKVKNEKEDVWGGNIWDVAKNNTYILRYLRIKSIRDSKGKIVYYIGIYSKPKLKEGDKLIDIQEDSLVDELEIKKINYLNPIFKSQFDSSKKNFVIAVKLTNYKLLKYQFEGEENKLTSLITDELNKLCNGKIVVASPEEDLFLVGFSLNKLENNVSNIMKEIDFILSSLKLNNKKNSIAYLSGVAISNEGENINELLKNAFIALEALLKFKKSKYLIYNLDIFNLVKKDKEIRNEIKNAFLDEEFYVYYQIQKSSDDLNITGVEALIRWKNKKLGIVSPVNFIPIIEDTHYIKQVGEFVLKRCIRDFSSIKSLINKDFKISINLSSFEFMDSLLIKNMVSQIKNSDLEPKHFCFEITESNLVENIDYTNELIKKLHKDDIIVAIDDFGTGFSSLSYLKNLSADKLKIDRMFIKDYPKSDDGSILRGIINMAKELNISLICEGVETKEQLDFVNSLGCEEYQGYYGSKPTEFENIKKILIESKEN